MHTKTVEGLAGASTNMKLLNTPSVSIKTQSGEVIQRLWNGQWDMSVNLQIKRRTIRRKPKKE